MSQSNAVAKREPKPLPADMQARVDDMKMRNAIIAQIRGAMWGKDLNETQIRALAQYCRENNLDAVRHVEVLGGKPYLTAEFYDERGAWLIRDGLVVPDQPDYIHADERLDKLAAAGDPWGKQESERRLRARIQFGVPESAKAAVVQRMRIVQSGAVVVGVNWCGTGRRDPVGDAEPTKTAQTRARRRAWRQIAEVIPAYGNVVRPVEARATAIAPVLTVEPSQPALPPRGTAGGAAQAFGGYGDEPMPDATRVIPGQAADGEPIYEAHDDEPRDSRDPDQLGLGEEG